MQLTETKSKLFLTTDNLSLSTRILNDFKTQVDKEMKSLTYSKSTFQSLLDYQPNLALIDISFSSFNSGFELAESIRKNLNIALVFLTSDSGKTVIDRIKHFKPDGLVVVPFTKECLITTVELAISNFYSDYSALNQQEVEEDHPTNGELFIRDHGWLKKIKAADILWIKTEGTYLHIFVKGKQYTLRKTAKKLFEELDKTQFIRVHKSFIINLKKIDAFNSSQVKIEGIEIPVGRNYYKDLIQMVNKGNS